MATAQNVLDLEASQIGIGGTNNIYNTWIWGHECYDPNVYPWCAAFQSWCLSNAGLPINPSAAASGVFNQYPRVADEDVQPGDLVVFNWDGRQDTGWCDHIGMVEWFDHSTGYFGTIEGNTGNSAEGEVLRQTRYNYTNYFTAFSRPPYDGNPYNPVIPPQPDDPSGKLGVTIQAWSQAQGILPAVTDNADNAGDGSPMLYFSACPTGGVLDVQANDLPVLQNPCNISDTENGAVGDGGWMKKLSMFLWSPNNDQAIFYRVMVNGYWLAWMKDHTDLGGSGDNYAGNGVDPIQRVEAYIDWA